MGWRNWNYKEKLALIFFLLWVILFLISFISPFIPNLYVQFFFYNIKTLISAGIFLILGFFIGWIVDSVKSKDSATKICLLIGISILILVSAFMFYYCITARAYGTGMVYRGIQEDIISCFFFNFNANNGWFAMVMPLIIFTLIGLFIDLIRRKIKNTKINSKEIIYSVIISVVFVILISGLHYSLIGKDGTYVEWGTTFNLPFFCEKVESLESQTYCYSLIAHKKGNTALCENIRDSLGKGICYADFVRYSKYDSSLCYNTKDEKAKDICITHTTENENDCDKIQDEEAKDNCYFLYADTKRDSLICPKIKTLENRDKCYKRVAELTENSVLCEKIQIQKEREDCYVTAAWQKKDSTLCEKIINPETKNWCYSNCGC